MKLIKAPPLFFENNIIKTFIENCKLIILISLAGLIFGFINGIITPDLYSSSTVVMPVDKNSNRFDGMLNDSLSGLSSIVGERFNENDNMIYALNRMQSKQFILEFIKENNLEKEIINTSWGIIDRKKKVIDKEYIESNKSDWELYTRFKKIYSVNEDKKNKTVIVTVKWYDPVKAATWANLLIEKINNQMRYEEKNKSEKLIKILNEKLENTQLVSMQKIFFNIVENQMKTMMLASVSTEYVFRVIDPATVQINYENKKIFSKTLIGLISGLLLGSLIVICKKNFNE